MVFLGFVVLTVASLQIIGMPPIALCADVPTLSNLIISPTSEPDLPVTIPYWLEFAAVASGAISGASRAANKKLDWFGAVALAVACGLGGGMIRDIMLQTVGIYAFQMPSLIVACIVLGIAVFYFARVFSHLNTPVFYIDALSVGLWAFISVDKALQAGETVLPAIILGTLAAVGGGVLRDLLIAEVPQVFRAGSTFYGIAGMAGSIVYALLAQFHVIKPLAALLCVIVVLALRLLSERLGWRTHEAHDLTHHVARPFKGLFSHPRRTGQPTTKSHRFRHATRHLT